MLGVERRKYNSGNTIDGERIKRICQFDCVWLHEINRQIGIYGIVIFQKARESGTFDGIFSDTVGHTVNTDTTFAEVISTSRGHGDEFVSRACEREDAYTVQPA